MARSVILQTELPELGTSEAALKGCADLIARMCGRPVDIVQYWLDCYYQVRLRYEAGKAQRRLREGERLRAFEAAMRRLRDEAAAQEPDEAVPAPQPETEPAAEEKIKEEPVTERSVTPPPPTGELTVEICRKPSDQLTGFETVGIKNRGAPRGNTSSSDAAKFKRETLARLMRMRGDGLTIERVILASNGNLTDDIVLNILQARKMPIAHYRKLAAALDKIEKEEITRT